MKQLNREAFARARQFLKTLARPLERTLFEHLFEAAPMDSVTVELACFQNEVCKPPLSGWSTSSGQMRS